MEFTDYPTEEEESEFTDYPTDENSDFTDYPVDDSMDAKRGGRTFSEAFIRDPLVSVGKSIVSAGEAGAGLLSLTAPWARNLLNYMGYDPKAMHEVLEGQYSPAQQKANKAVAQAGKGMGFVGEVKETAKAHLSNPSTIVHGIIQQAPNFMAIKAVGAGLVANGFKTLLAAPIAEGLVTTSHLSEQITQDSPGQKLDAKGRVAAVAGGMITGAISTGCGRVANKFGFADFDSWMVGHNVDPKKAMGRIASIVYGALGESFEEFTQEAQEGIIVNAALGKPLMDGVAKAATSGGIIGGITGGATNVFTGVGLTDPRRFDQPPPRGSQDISAQPNINLDTVFDETNTDSGFQSGLTPDSTLDIAKRREMDDAITQADGEFRQNKAREQQVKEKEAQIENQKQQVQAQQTQAYQAKLAENEAFDEFVKNVQEPSKFREVVGTVVHNIEMEKPTPFSKLAKQAHKILSIDSEINFKRNQELAYELTEYSKHTSDRYERFITGTLAQNLLEQNELAMAREEFTDEPVQEDVHKPISGPVKKATSLEDAVGKPDGTITPISGKSTQEVTIEGIIGKRAGEKPNREFKVEPGDLDVSKLRITEPTTKESTPTVGAKAADAKPIAPVVEPKSAKVVQPQPKLATPIKQEVKTRKPKVEKPKAPTKPVKPERVELSKGDVRADSIREVMEDLVAKSQGRRMFPIYQIMEESGLSDREFREGVKLLRNDMKIQLHGGDPSIMTKEQIAKSFKDERGDLFLNLSLRGDKKRDKLVHHGGGKLEGNKFDLNKVGRGEGTQNEGHGIYFAADPDSTNYYQAAYGGYKYTVDIPDVKLDTFLKWDEPVSNQHPTVKRNLKSNKLTDIIGDTNIDGLTGKEIYNKVADKSSKKEASELFRSLGIPGNIYKTGSYVKDGKLTRDTDYVVWDQDLLDSVKVITDQTPQQLARTQDLEKAKKLFDKKMTEQLNLPKLKRLLRGKSNEVVSREVVSETGWYRDKQGNWIDKSERGSTRDSFVGRKGAPLEAKEALENLETGAYFTTGEFAESVNKAQVEMTNDPKVGGSTFSPFGENLAGTDSIAVSIFPELSRTFKGKLSEKQLSKFKRDNALAMIKNPMLAFGTWYDKGSDQTYLDVVLRVPRDFKDIAIDLGKEFNQKAVFDLKTFDEIETGGTGENKLTREQRLDRDEKLSELLHDDTEVREKIWKETGWWEYMPGKWAFELDDTGAKFKDGALDKLEDAGNFGMLLDQVLDHPALFKAHPHLKTVTVVADAKAGAAFWRFDKDVGGSSVRIEPSILRDGYKGRSAMQIMMHELQHGVQWQEGFSPGGSPRAFSILKSKLTIDGNNNIPTPLHLAILDKIRSMEKAPGDHQLWRTFDKKPVSFSNEEIGALKKSWTEILTDGLIKDPKDLVEYQESLDMLKNKYIATLEDLPYAKYLKLGGEVQSRLVEKRLNMTPEEKAKTPPWESLEEMLYDEGLMKEGDRLEDILDAPVKSGEVMGSSTIEEGVQKIGKIRSEKDQGIEAMVNRLQDLSKKADKVVLVEKQSMLPESLGRGDVETAIEATWDQKEGKIYFVLENIKDADQALKVWMHEQVGHKGLTELFEDQGVEFNDFLDFAYDTVKKSPALFKEISEQYHDSKLSETEQKRLIVEEVLARRAERLNPFARKSVFQKLLDFMNKWVRKVTGFKQEDIHLTMKDLDNLLEAAKNRLIYGETRDWLEFKHSDKEYKDWAKEVLAKNPRAMNWYTTGTEGITSVLEKDSDLYKFALGITSAATDVKSNAVYAAQTYAYLAGKRDKPAGRYPSIVGKKIDRLKAGDKTFGQMYKVDEFVRGLLGDPNSTTNDRWMHFLLFGPHMLTAKDIGVLQTGTGSYRAEADLLSLFSRFENTAARHKMFELAHELTKETGHEWEPRQVQAALWMKAVSEGSGTPLESMKYDYAQTFFKHKSPQLGREIGRDTATPWEYIQHIVGDDVGRVREIAGMEKIEYDPQSQLDELYRKHLETKGVKEVPGFTKEDVGKVRHKISDRHEHLALRDTPRGIVEHINAYTDSARDWFKEKVSSIKEGSLQEALFDDLHRVKEYSGTAWKSLRLYRGLPSVIGSLLKDGQIVWDDTTNHVKLGNADGGLLKPFQGMSREMLTDVKARLVAERVRDIIASGTFTQEFIDRIYGDDANGQPINPTAYTNKLLADTAYLNNDKHYKEAKDHLRKYNTEILNIAEKSGLISSEARQKFEQYDYIPLNRIFPDDTDIGESPLFKDSNVRVGNLKKFKGSAGYTIGDPIDNLARNYSYLLSQSLKNVAFKKLYNDGKTSGMLVHQKMSPAMYARAKQTHDYITMKVGGKEQYVRVDDARLFHALAEMDDSAFTIKTLNMAKKALTWGVTVAPAFRIRNLLRDTGHTWILMGKVNPLSVTKAFVDVMREHIDMQKLRAMGGASLGGFYSADNPQHMRQLIDNSQKVKGQGTKIWNLWARLGEASENANRLALFRALQAEGKSEMEAGFEARDLLDFSAHGKSKVARFLTSTVPFLNARLQGLNKIGRQIAHGDRVKIALRGAAVASASILLHCLNKAGQPDDDRWYDNLNDRERWLFWHFGKNIAVPKPFEVGAIFGELPTRLWDVGAEIVTGNDQEALKEFFKFGVYTATETLSLNPLGQGMIPVEQWANKDFYRGTPIVPQYLGRVAPELQWDDKTSHTARAIGKQFHVSPKRVDHVIDKLFSYAGHAALAASDYVLQPWLQHPIDPAYTTDDFYWLHGRIPRGKQRYIKQEQEFYDLFAEVDRVMATFNRLKKLDLAEARAWRDEHGKALRVHPRMSQIRSKLADLRNREREIFNDDGMDAETKRKELDALIDRRHDIILRHLKRMKEKLGED